MFWDLIPLAPLCRRSRPRRLDEPPARPLRIIRMQERPSRRRPACRANA